MSSTVGLLLLLTAAAINAQFVPQFEPLLSSNTVSIGISERPQIGDEVIATKARGLGGETVVYGVDLSSNDLGVFVMNPQTGQLTVGPNGPERMAIVDKTPVMLLAEVFAYYNSSGSAEANRAYLFVNVEVLDVNDAPQFSDATLDTAASETTNVGDVITTLNAVDHDLSNNGLVVYSMQQLAPTGQNTFTLNEFTGDLVLAQSLDLQTSYQIRVTATDFGVPPLIDSVVVTVHVAPVPPTFSQTVYTAEILEFTSQSPATVVTVTATDIAAPATPIVYSVGTVIPTAPDVTFSIGQSNGVLTVRGTVDRETHSRYFVQVLAHESGHESVSLGAGSATVVVTIGDVNEPPEFLSSHYTAVISEDAVVGDTLSNALRAVDYDQGANSMLTYSITTVTGLRTQDGMRVTISDTFFRIDTSSAVVTVNVNLEREAVQDGYHYYEISVTVADSGSPPLTDTTILAVTVEDINDNPPIFIDTVLSFTIPENRDANTPIGEFTVSDSDQGSSAEMMFTLQGDFADRFYVSTASVMYSTSLEAQPPVVTRGRVLNRVPLDREEMDSYQLTLTAMDRSLAPLSASIPLTVTVSEVNDNTPMFASPNVTFVLPEDTTTPFVIASFTVSDADIGTNGQVAFSLSADTQGLFSLNIVQALVAELTLSHTPDRETRSSYNFRMFATDRGFPALIGETDITIVVGDVNDNSPVFATSLYESSLVENTPPGPLIATVTATDSDIGVNAEITYSAPNQNLVTVNGSSGEVTLASPPDHEQGAIVNIQILATDGGDPALTGTTTLRITLTDVNDNAPVFEEERYSNVSVLEGVAPGSQFTRIVATDADSGNFGEITYSIEGSSSDGLFEINTVTGHLTVERVLDRETDITSYIIIVGAADNGNPPMRSQVFVDIQLADANDNTPMFLNEPYSANINEGVDRAVGKFVANISAEDADIGSNSEIEFSLAGDGVDYFSIHPSSGEIRVSETGVDFESLDPSNPFVILSVIATDLGTPARIATTTINITIVDGNDNAPQFIGTPYTFSIPESSSTDRTLVVTLNATDLDMGAAGTIRYQLVEGNTELFEINEATGEVFLAAGVSFDREATDVPHHENGDAVYSLVVTASDMGSPEQTSITTVLLLVTDVNDNSPIFPVDTIPLTLSESLPIESFILNLVATDNDFGINAQLNYTIVSETTATGTITEDFTFSVTVDTGVLSLAKSLDRETVPAITLVVVATDQGMGYNQDTVTIVFNVTDANDNRPIFVIPSGGYVANVLENATVGSEIITVMATDLDQGIHQSITYSVLSNTTTGMSVPFEIRDPTTGVITVAGRLDRELTTEYQLVVIATDSADNPDSVQQTFAMVMVNILDVNDNTPVFDALSYRGVVMENTPLGTTVQLTSPLMVTDPDTSPLFFSLLGNHAQLFTINQSNGVITTNTDIDYELQTRYSELTLQVSDGVQSSSVPMEIAVIDDNDNSPTFDPDFVILPVTEDTGTGIEIYVARATDADSGSNGLRMYSIEGEGEQLFNIGLLTGVITLTGQLDFETEQVYMLTVTVVDSGVPILNGSLDITIQVVDVNDNPPTILNPSAEFTIAENAAIGSLVGMVSAVDGDSVDLRFVITNGNEANQFLINGTTGEITVASDLNREAQDSYRLLIQVMDTSDFPLTDETFITIVLEDVNDETPVISEPNVGVEISESAGVGSEVHMVVASDADIGNNSALLYFIQSQLPEEHFIINAETGAIYINATLDRETIPQYELIITVQDQGLPPLNTSGIVCIIILDENDNTPAFENSSYTLTVPEGSYGSDSNLLVVSATDSDIGNNGLVSYSILSVLSNGVPVNVENSPFGIDSLSGAVLVSGELDREGVASYSLQLQAADSGNPPRQTQALLIVSVTDVNDNAPMFDTGETDFTVTEGAIVGSIIGVVRATDQDEGVNAEIEYRFTGVITEGDLLGIDQSGSIFVNGSIDRERLESPLMITVEAVNSRAAVSLFNTLQVSIEVLDVNDNPPVFEIDPTLVYSIAESASVGAKVTTIEASDADIDENGEITFRVANQDGSIPFSFDSSGNLLVSSSLDRETTPQYMVTIEASDSGTPSLSSQTSITVNILDVNDNLPEFEGNPVFTIQESQTPGLPFGRIDTIDRDVEKRAFYFVIGGSNIVGVDSRTGDMFLRTNVDFDVGQTELTVTVAAVSTDSTPGAFCSPGVTCNVATVTINVEDANDNRPVLPEYDFGVNQSAVVDTVIGQVVATDVDTGDFGMVNYEFVDSQSLFSLDAQDGTIRLTQTFNASTDDKYNVVPIRVFDSLNNRLQSFSVVSLTRIHFVEESELVILILTNTLAEVQPFLQSLRLDLADDSNEVGVFIFDIKEYTTTLDLSTPPPDAPQRRQIIELPKLNITMFAVNRTALGVLPSDEFISQLASTIEASVSIYPGLSFDGLIVHPVPPTPAPDPLPRETILLILYIVVGALGALIIFIVLAAFVICCYLRCSKSRKQSYMPGIGKRGGRPPSTVSNLSAESGVSGNKDAHNNPLWIDPYGRWSDKDAEMGTVEYRERSVDEPSKSNRESKDSVDFRTSVLYETQDFVMANFTEGDQETDNDEEAMVEIKPDTQSLSQQSTGDSTFERHRRDRQPLIKKGRAWNDNDLRTSAAELELTAGEDESDNDESGSEEYTDEGSEVTEGSEEGDDDEEDPDEEYSTEEGSEDEEDDDDEYDYGDDPNFPEDGFPELSNDPLMF